MDVWIETNWFAVNTKPYREDMAAMNIGRLGLEVLLPRIMASRAVLGIQRTVSAPLFPSYLFARFSPQEFLHSIRYARGVRKVVSAGDTPVPVDSAMIDSIRARMDHDGYVELEPKRFHAGDEVFIHDGFLQGLTGVFERELSGEKRVMILLQSIEYQARVFIDKRFLSRTMPETV